MPVGQFQKWPVKSVEGFDQIRIIVDIFVFLQQAGREATYLCHLEAEVLCEFRLGFVISKRMA